jgi:hypothetical protein
MNRKLNWPELTSNMAETDGVIGEGRGVKVGQQVVGKLPVRPVGLRGPLKELASYAAVVESE